MKMTGAEFMDWPNKAITLMGMSGVGKTTLANNCPKSRWFHYSGDYRIGTKYLAEPILDNIKRQAMKVDFLRDLLRSDSIYIASNITVHNLAPVATFLGKIGRSDLDGLSGGSVCELNDPKTLEILSKNTLIIYLRADPLMEEKIIQRAIDNPKPMYYQEEFLDLQLNEYLKKTGLNDVDEIIPDDFVRWIFPKHVENRRSKYQVIAEKYGYTVDAGMAENVTNEAQFIDMIARALD